VAGDPASAGVLLSCRWEVSGAILPTLPAATYPLIAAWDAWQWCHTPQPHRGYRWTHHSLQTRIRRNLARAGI